MKTPFRLLPFVLILLLCSCRTVRTVSDSRQERIQSDFSSVDRAQLASGVLQRTFSEENVRKDSVVERFRDRLVTDACGRILWRETEHTKDRYTSGTGTRKTQDSTILVQDTVQYEQHLQQDAEKTDDNHTEKKIPTKGWSRFWFLLGIILTVSIGLTLHARR